MDYYGGQNIYKVFGEAAQHGPGLAVGSHAVAVRCDLDEATAKAYAGSGTLFDAFNNAQKKTLAAIKSKGVKVG